MLVKLHKFGGEAILVNLDTVCVVDPAPEEGGSLLVWFFEGVRMSQYVVESLNDVLDASLAPQTHAARERFS